MKAYSHVTIEEAAEIAKTHGLDQLVIWHFREGEGLHVTTYGHPLGHSLRAAEAGNAIKKAAGWPEELRKSLPWSLIPIVTEWELRMAGEIRSGVLHKGTVLAALMMLRDCIRVSDPQLAEQMLFPDAEQAQPEGKGA